MATTAAPPALASSGKISGVGLAQAKMTAPAFMVCTISLVTTPGADTPMNTSAPASTSAREPVRFSGFVTWAIASLIQFMPSLRPA